MRLEFVGLISFTIIMILSARIFLQMIHASFFRAQGYSAVCKYFMFFICSSVGGQIGCFQDACSIRSPAAEHTVGNRSM